MAKVWVLDTSTKGTGAEMVPLEKVLRKPTEGEQRVTVPPKPRPKERHAEPRSPRRFKVVDVLSGEVLAQDAGTRETVDLLAGIRSVVDVDVHVWEPKAGRWRPLTLGERQTLWEFRGR